MTHDVSYSDYREQIELMADMVEEAIAEDPVRDVTELVFEEVDSHQWIIYNGYHLDVLEHSEEGPQEWSTFVKDNEQDHRAVLSAMAFTAMRADLCQELRDRGVY